MKHNTPAIKVHVNQAKLVDNLRYSFTSQTTFLGELMQNARRAKATQVEFEFFTETQTLRVTDDGSGIADLSVLLAIAESGWDAAVVATEAPFGMGFLAALFSCQEVTVASKGGKFLSRCDAILAFQPVTVAPVTGWDGKTVITMAGLTIDAATIKKTLKHNVRGFPIPVVYNREPLERKQAIDSGLGFIQTGIGAVSLAGVEVPAGAHLGFELYLQGLPVYSGLGYGNGEYLTHNKHVVHLDPTRFFARLPDRDKLINEQNVVDEVKAVLAKVIEAHFTTLKTQLPEASFIQFYDMLQGWKLLHLLNDVPVVPRQVFSVVSDIPVCDTFAFGDFLENPGYDPSRGQIEAGQVVSIDDDIETDGAARYLFAWKRGCLVYRGGLDARHWLNALVRPLSREVAAIEPLDVSHAAYFNGDWVWIGVLFCRAYRVTLGEDSIEVDDIACYQGSENGNAIIQPQGTISGEVLKQVSSYQGELDEFQEVSLEKDMEAFTAFVVANTAGDPAEALKMLLPEFAGCPALYGKTFQVTLGVKGEVTLVRVTGQ